MDEKEGKDLNNFSLGFRMAWVLLISIFIGEGLVMLLVQSLHIKHYGFEALIDSLFLSFLTFPSIYYFVIRPLTIQSKRRKQAELAIMESERRYKTLFERSNDAIFKVDTSTGKYLDANHAAEILTGRSVDELRKLKTSDLTPLDADKRLEKIINNKETLAMGEVDYQRLDGTTRTALLTSIPLDEGQIFGFAHDITEWKRLNNEIKNSLALTEAVLESIHNGLLVVSLQGTIIKSNAKFAEMWQIPADILSSRDDKTLLNCVLEQLADPVGFIAKVNELYEKPAAESIDLIELKDGRIFKRISKPMYLGGMAKGRVWSFLDITERIKAQQSLLKSEANLQTLLHTIPDLIWLKDLNGVYLSCNSMFELLIGRKETEIIGKNDFDFFEAEQAEFFRNNDQIAFEADKPTSNEEWLTFADNGYSGLFDVIKTPMYDAKGTFIGILGIGHDITLRKRMEMALLESEEKYRFLFANNPQPMWIFDLETLAFLEVNNAAVNHYGYSKEEFLRMTIKDIRPEEDLAALQKEINHSGKSDREWSHIKKNGEHILVEISAHSLIYNGRQASHILIHDISDRKRAEEALKESEARFRSVLETMSLIGVMIDSNGRITLCNDYLLGLSGWKREEVLQQNWFDLFVPQEIRTSYNLDDFQATIKSGEVPKHYENEIITRHGERRLIAWNNTILHDPLGAVSGVASIGEDITERKRDEAEIKLKTEQLLKLNTEKDKFFSIIAHDLRSPFTSFLALTQLMAEDLPNLSMTELQEITVIISKSATNLYRLLENLLQWSQIQQGAIPFNQEPISLNDTVLECVEMIQGTAKFKEIEITSDIPFDLEAFADNNMLQTVIRNLLSNAVKFTHKGGKVSLSAKENGNDKIEIWIKDTGIGMSPEIIANLFRIDVKINRPGTDGEPSTGLGLLLCKELIEKNGGDIYVESAVDKGSVFYFTLPCKN